MNLSLSWSAYELISLKTKPASYWEQPSYRQTGLPRTIVYQFSSVASQRWTLYCRRNKNKQWDFQGEASLYIRLSVVSTKVFDLDSSSQSSLSSSQDNVSVSGQSNRVLIDLWKDPYTIQSHPRRTNFLRSCLRMLSRCSGKYPRREWQNLFHPRRAGSPA